MEDNNKVLFRLEDGEYYTILSTKYKNRKKYEKATQVVKAAIPGTIMSISVTEGQKVKRGDILCVMDSMKMNNSICSNQDGVVVKINVSVGAAVGKDSPLFELKDGVGGCCG